MAKWEGLCVGACAEVGDVCEWEAFMRGENYGWLFGEVGLVSQVFTLDEHSPGHPHICRCAKFKQNWTIHNQVIAI